MCQDFLLFSLLPLISFTGSLLLPFILPSHRFKFSLFSFFNFKCYNFDRKKIFEVVNKSKIIGVRFTRKCYFSLSTSEFYI